MRGGSDMGAAARIGAGGVDVRIEGLSKRFQKGEHVIEVLRDVNLRIGAGERVAILGKSGSGKSTFLHVLGTLDKPTTGRIWFNDEDVFQRSGAQLDALRNREVGFVFQFHHLLPDHDALRNVMMPALISGASPAQANERAELLLRRVGLGHRMTHRPSRLSGGEQQRVAIARAMMRKPNLLLADEPTGNLDPHTADDVLEAMLELNAEAGSTLVVVTHSDELAARFPRRLKLVEGHFVEEE